MTAFAEESTQMVHEPFFYYFLDSTYKIKQGSNNWSGVHIMNYIAEKSRNCTNHLKEGNLEINSLRIYTFLFFSYKRYNHSFRPLK